MDNPMERVTGQDAANNPQASVSDQTQASESELGDIKRGKEFVNFRGMIFTREDFEQIKKEGEWD